MEVSNPRSALLSDYEVLRLLRDVEQQQKNQQEQQQQQPLGTTTPASLDRSDEWMRAIPENLRTVQFEAIAFLSSADRPCARQSEEGITALMRDLKPFALTKGEKLQVVNHAPSSVLELHVLIEEFEDRFSPEETDHLLTLIATHSSSTNSLSDLSAAAHGADAQNGLGQETAAEPNNVLGIPDGREAGTEDAKADGTDAQFEAAEDDLVPPGGEDGEGDGMGALEHDEGEDEEFEADDGNAGAGAYDMDED